MIEKDAQCSLLVSTHIHLHTHLRTNACTHVSKCAPYTQDSYFKNTSKEAEASLVNASRSLAVKKQPH